MSQTKKRDYRTFVLGTPDAPVRSPRACACCLAEATCVVNAVKIEREEYGVARITRTRAIPFPYCTTCGEHVRWSRTGDTHALVMGAIVAVGVAFFVGIVISACVTGGLFHSGMFETRDRLCLLASIAAGCGPGYAVARHFLRMKPAVPVSAEHTCAKSKSAEIVKFSETYTQLRFARPEFGRAFAKLND